MERQPKNGRGGAGRSSKTGAAEAAPSAQLSFESRLTVTRPPGPLPATATAPAVVPAPALPEEPSQLPDGARDGLRDAPRDGAGPRETPRIFRVCELVRSARLMLESRYNDIRVEGELSRLTRSGPGHIYFCLKDDTAVVDCVMFAREASRLKFKPEEGTAVLVRGRVTIFEGRGKFQLSVSSMEPTGAGALALAFEQLKKKLAAEGLFAETRKRPIPFLPRRVGVVTSPTGAVIRDIIHVAHRRFPARILLAPTVVQGSDACPRIVAALQALARVPDVDVIIVARGGGSLEDLWAFNEEPLARAIAACRVPVISAVGHETDFTIADFVADLRCPTPSAAAERAVPVAVDLRADLQAMARRAASAVQVKLRAAHLVLERARGRLGDPRRLIDQRRQIVDELQGRMSRRLTADLARRRATLRQAEMALLRNHPQRRIAEQRQALQALEQRLVAGVRQLLERRKRALATYGAKLDGLSPLKVLDRGYGLVRSASGGVVTRAAQVAVGDQITVKLREGAVDARVEKTRE